MNEKKNFGRDPIWEQKIRILFMTIILIFLSLFSLWFYPFLGYAIIVFSFFILCFSCFSVLEKKNQTVWELSQTKKENKEPALKKISTSIAIPIPYAVLDQNNRVLLANNAFQELFSGTSVKNTAIYKLIADFKPQLQKQRVEIGVGMYELFTYQEEIPSTKEQKGSTITSICLVDVSENEALKQAVNGCRPVVGLVFIDNYEEVLESIDDASVPLLTALIDRKLNTLASEHEGVIKKFERDRYLLFISQENLEKIKERKFDILNEMRSINIGNHIPVTLSIGIGSGCETIEKNAKAARSAMDLALGRGGDQVLIKEGENYLFYGGKSTEVAHNARIRARVKADALTELIGEASFVLVMGHRKGDLDSLGSSIGITCIARAFGKKAYIVLDEVSNGVKNLYERLTQQEGYHDLFLTGQKALEMIGEETLLVITDTHRKALLENPILLDYVKKVVLFDHHRKSTDFIDTAVLTYHEPYASSTSELVTEVIQYIGDKVLLRPVEADALLGGIMLDTKNFIVKTGTITFEAAAYLRRHGADSQRIRLLFQYDMSMLKSKAATVQQAELFLDSIAISVCPLEAENSIVMAAQAADELLNVAGIKASFVLCQIDNRVYVSARSLCGINVQMIMEKLGGGGHQTVSGAQFLDITIEEVKEKVKKAIKDYIQEENEI